jgi:CheY-like chemotaxis protein
MEELAGNSRHRFRILVVDDHHDSANTIAAILGMLGNHVSIANDGAQAVELAERVRPELILMDVGMPRLNGYEATELIRKEPWGGDDIVIIALTGRSDKEDRRRSKAAGCNGHLVKPVQLADLETLLAELKSARPDR